MIPPLDEETWNRVCPPWAKLLKQLAIPHVVDLPVYDILRCQDRGVVDFVREYDDSQYIGVIRSDGRTDCAGAHYVADLDTESGREHVMKYALALSVERDELIERRDSLIRTVVRIANETPYPDEIKGWEAQRAAMLAEIGTLKARVAELERAEFDARNEAAADRAQRD